MGKPLTTIVVAGVVIKKDGKYLLVQENRPGTDIHGLWNLPAGKVDEGSTIEETAIREAKEETGYDVELISKLDIFQLSAQTPPKHAFEARIIGGQLLRQEDEVLDVKWFTLREIEDMQNKLREEWVLGAINMVENNK